MIRLIDTAASYSHRVDEDQFFGSRPIPRGIQPQRIRPGRRLGKMRQFRMGWHLERAGLVVCSRTCGAKGTGGEADSGSYFYSSIV